MFVPDYFSFRYEMEDGLFTRIVTAHHTVRRGRRRGERLALDVYRENENGVHQSRNLYQCMLYGYAVAFPGFPRVKSSYSWYFDAREAWVEGWQDCGRKLRESDFSDARDWDRKAVFAVCEKYPDFRYLADKRPPGCRKGILETLVMWKKHPELELVIAAGYERCGMDGRFWRMTEANRKRICLFMRRHRECGDFSLEDVKRCAFSADPDLAAAYCRYVSPYERERITMDDMRYLLKAKGVKGTRGTTAMQKKVSLFYDMLRMLETSAHDADDPYWRHPRDLQATHDRLLAEKEAEKQAAILDSKNMRKIMRTWCTLPRDAGGYQIFVSTDIAEWDRQAKALHQCIVAGNYLQRMADGDCVICFIQKDGKPEATAQVMPDGSVHQFYADELDRSNCLPSDEIKCAFTAWLDAAKERGVCPGNPSHKEAQTA